MSCTEKKEIDLIRKFIAGTRKLIGY